MCTFVHVCVHACMYVCLCVCMVMGCVYICTHVHVCICTCVYLVGILMFRDNKFYQLFHYFQHNEGEWCNLSEKGGTTTTDKFSIFLNLRFDFPDGKCVPT